MRKILFIILLLVLIVGCTKEIIKEDAGLNNSTNIIDEQDMVEDSKEIENNEKQNSERVCAKDVQSQFVGPHVCNGYCKTDEDCKLSCCGSINKNEFCIDDDKGLDCIINGDEIPGRIYKAVCAGTCVYKISPIKNS
ncbi:hypothetical protein GOV04_00235 [Candidatus Woesearchaeota archaeon]|nr:hypothetical protein [Candidatus Woesearchaeota archaeon]